MLYNLRKGTILLQWDINTWKFNQNQRVKAQNVAGSLSILVVNQLLPGGHYYQQKRKKKKGFVYI